MDHLHSLHALPTHSLEAFSIVRREPPPRVQGGTPIYEVVVDEAVTLKPVPHEFVDSIKRAKSLRTFECDWWAWSIADIKAVLESCVHLEVRSSSLSAAVSNENGPRLVQTIKLCLASSFLKLLNLTSTFAALPNLRRLSICVDPAHAPGKPPTPAVPTSRSSLPTPTESPALKSKSVLPQLLDLDHIHAQNFSTAEVVGDPSMPLLRDIKRFVRKCPRLELLGSHSITFSDFFPDPSMRGRLVWQCWTWSMVHYSTLTKDEEQHQHLHRVYTASDQRRDVVFTFERPNHRRSVTIWIQCVHFLRAGGSNLGRAGS
jgi:hypothetical protein